ncbi:MAG: hypothetical protein ACJ74H_10850 [Thermoanaerobaculia bacterium]
MKKLVLILALLLLPLSAAAAEVSDMILSPNGTLYTISSEIPPEGSEHKASKYLVLTERRGDEIRREIVPASTETGTHTNGLLGYDPESGTIFVFWVQHFGFLYNQLLFCARSSDGTWSEATAFGSPFNYRENLRVAVTRKVSDDDGQQSAALSIHATWWEFSTETGIASAQYWMLPIENGQVVDATEVDLHEFIEPFASPAPGPEDVDPSVYKHPQIISSPDQDSVSLVFGDPATRSFRRVRFTPSRGVRSEGRLRVPVGKLDGGFPAPRFKVGAEARLDSVFGTGNRAAFYTVADKRLEYVILSDGTWSDRLVIALDEQVSQSAAVGALQRMFTDQ